jgi:hypothetical protein
MRKRRNVVIGCGCRVHDATDTELLSSELVAAFESQPRRPPSRSSIVLKLKHMPVLKLKHMPVLKLKHVPVDCL